MNIRKNLYSKCLKVIGKLYPFIARNELSNYVVVTHATKIEYGHYQCNAAMKLSKKFAQLHIGKDVDVQRTPLSIANEIKTSFEHFHKDHNDLDFIVEVISPGFINFTLTVDSINRCLTHMLKDPRLGVTKSGDNIKVIVDFSSPNIAKEMHVGHLRSTIIGDCVARVLEFLGYEVLRLNHVGDWGTPFGMLIQYLKRKHLVHTLKALTVHDLVLMYQEAKILFDQDADFKQQAQLEVIKLQGLDRHSLEIWQELCAISMKNYQQIYDLLDIKLITRGESFYSKFLEDMISELTAAHLVSISDGAKCVYFPEFKNRESELLPLIIQKQDGGYNYATTDLAAIKYRVTKDYGRWLIYVTDAGQSLHFAMVFACARAMGWLQDVRVDHVPFGLVLNEMGGKIKTREGKATPLLALINTAVERASNILIARNEYVTEEEVKLQANVLGINAIKYADLSNNRMTNYKFNYDHMLAFEGNTAAFLLYAYVRINSIVSKINVHMPMQIEMSFDIQEEAEKILAIALLQFPEVCAQFIDELLPNKICDYLFTVAERFHKFFHHCRVEGHVQQSSRLSLCLLTHKILEQGFALLGLQTLKKM